MRSLVLLVSLLLFMIIIVTFLTSSSSLTYAQEQNQQQKQEEVEEEDNSDEIDSWQKSRSQQKYHEIEDLFIDVAKKMCSSLGKLVRPRKKFNWKSRCDVLYEALERIANQVGDAMITELDLTQQDLVDSALWPENYYNIVSKIKDASKKILSRKYHHHHAQNNNKKKNKISEEALDLEMHQLFTEVILKAATQDRGNAAYVREFPREARKNAQLAGIRLPTYGLDDVDELDEENFLTGQDLQWVQSQRFEGVDEREIEEKKRTEKENGGDNFVDESSEEEDEKLIDELSKETWLIE